MSIRIDRATTHPPLAPVLLTIAAFLVAALPHLMAMPVLLAAAILAILSWRVAAAWYQWAPVPGFLRVFITLGLIILVVVAFGGLWGRRIATALLCLMLAAKMMEMYRPRDLRMVASVSFFLIATQFLFNERLIFLGYLVAGCWIATLALTRIHQIQPVGSNGIHPQPPNLRVSARGALALLALAMPVALALFVLFPRLAQPLWGLPDRAMDGRTGLSETMSPGSISELFIDDTPAFRVEFEGQPPPPALRYWRGPVLWRFDGSTWRRAFFSAMDTHEPVPVNESSIRYRVQLEPHERRWLLALDYPASSSMPKSRVTNDYQLISRSPITTLSQYDVISTPNFKVSPTLGAAQRMVALQLPADRNPRTRDLAADLRAQYPDDRELVDAVLRWFREEEFFYSLSAAPLGWNGADEFLFDLRTGYCEYYASAFAVLMRAAGIPTRVVTGYQGGFWSAAGQYLLVRQSDAHAWNEVWLDGSGWVRVDPTAAVAPSRILQGSRSVGATGLFMVDSDWVRNLRNQYDRVQHLWNRWVLGFDADRQRRLLDRLGLPDLGATGLGLLMLSVLAMIIAALAFLVLREHTGRTGSEAQRAWRRVLASLRRHGLIKPPGETPLEFAHRIGAALSDGGPGVVQLAGMYTRVHYGPKDHQLAAEFVHLANQFKPRLNRKRPRDSNN